QVPTFTCPDAGVGGLLAMTEWVPLDENLGGALVVLLHCDNGAEATDAYVFAAGGSTHFTDVAVGDRLDGSFLYRPATGEIRVKATNARTSETVTKTAVNKGLTFTRAAYLTIPAGELPLPTFDTIPFSHLTIDGAPAASKATFTRMDWYSGKQRLVHTG